MAWLGVAIFVDVGWRMRVACVSFKYKRTMPVACDVSDGIFPRDTAVISSSVFNRA